MGSLALSQAAVKAAKREDRWVRYILGVFAGLSILVTLGIILVLMTETSAFFGEVSLREFLFTSEWSPLFEPRKFGVLSLVAGTALVTAGAALIGLPGGLAVAIFLNEYAPNWLRNAIKPLIELLAGIPTVVYGYFAVTSITPLLQHWIPDTEVFNAASAAIVVGIMILPMVASLSDDALRSVPRTMLDAGYALGATRLEVLTHVTLPSALSGIMSAFILALSRAVGETMAVSLAAGSTPKLTLNPFESIQTLTAYIVQVSLGDTPHGSIEYQSIFAVGMLLFVITLIFNLLAHFLVRRFRKVYD